MELKKFITEVLTNIAEGVNESKDVYEALGGFVSPKLKSPSGTSKSFETFFDHHKEISNIEFEISLTNEEKEGRANGIGVMLGSINLGSKKDSNTSENIATKIKFSIPIIFP